ncbi:hypothetical protein [Vibrio phage RYC]|nr:hypothetical protein [Vibrio phage RYC]
MIPELVDQVEIAQDRPTSELRYKQNFQDFIEIYVEKAQEVEVALIELCAQKSIDTAQGEWLDLIGKIVGIDRQGLIDEEYRSRINLKISINSSDGTNGSMKQIFDTLTSPEFSRVNDGYNSYGQVMIRAPKNTIGKETFDILEQIRPVATKLNLIVDFSGISIAPAWEITSRSLENFEVNDGSVVDDLDVNLTENGPLDVFEVAPLGTSSGELQGTEGFNIPDYEDGNVRGVSFTTFFWELNNVPVTFEPPLSDFENTIIQSSRIYEFANIDLFEDFSYD